MFGRAPLEAWLRATQSALREGTSYESAAWTSSRSRTSRIIRVAKPLGESVRSTERHVPMIGSRFSHICGTKSLRRLTGPENTTSAHGQTNSKRRSFSCGAIYPSDLQGLCRQQESVLTI